MAEQSQHDPTSRAHSALSKGGERAATRSHRQTELDRRLDLALEETFPASDPVSILVAH